MNVRDAFRVGPQDLTLEPFPHILSTQMLEPAFYSRLVEEFPAKEYFENTGAEGGRTGRDLYPGEPAFEAFIRTSSAWQDFSNVINSAEFVDYAMSIFGASLAHLGCSVDPRRASYEHHIEPRGLLSSRPGPLGRLKSLLGGGEDPNTLFTRFDIEQGAEGYGKPVHCDLPNRIASLVLYFCDADELGMEGGELCLHAPAHDIDPRKAKRYPRAEETEVVAKVTPRHNTGVFFLCSNTSYHSVTPILSQSGYRRFVYINISSRAKSIW